MSPFGVRRHRLGQRDRRIARLHCEGLETREYPQLMIDLALVASNLGAELIRAKPVDTLNVSITNAHPSQSQAESVRAPVDASRHFTQTPSGQAGSLATHRTAIETISDQFLSERSSLLDIPAVHTGGHSSNVVISGSPPAVVFPHLLSSVRRLTKVWEPPAPSHEVPPKGTGTATVRAPVAPPSVKTSQEPTQYNPEPSGRGPTHSNPGPDATDRSGGTLRLAGPETEIFAPQQRSPRATRAPFTGQLIVKLIPGISSADVAAEYRATHIYGYPNLENTNLWTVSTPGSPEHWVARLGADRRIMDAYPVPADRLSTRGILNDPLLPAQWHLYNVGQGPGTSGLDGNVEAAWDLGATGRGAVIGIVDDGLQYVHPDLGASGLAANANGGNYVGLASYDFRAEDDDPAPATGADCSTADCHGTAMAGVAAGIGGNGVGGAGVAPHAQLGGIRVNLSGTCPDLGSSRDSQLAAALGWNTVRSGFDPSLIDIYSNSWGPCDNGTVQGAGPLLQTAISDGTTNGRGGLGSIYTWASGNGRTNNDNVNYDGFANNRHVIAVSALTETGVVASYSEPGASILIAAPSDGANGITTTDLIGTDGYRRTDYSDSLGGTSSASAYAAGVVALMLEANPNLSWRDVQHVLVQSATVTDPGSSDWSLNGGGRHINENYGFGLINASGAVSLASNWEAVGPELLVDSGTLTVNSAIPDGSTTGVTKSFAVVPNIRVEHVEVVFDATHPQRGDLEVLLTSPSGTQSFLARQRAQDTGANYSNWVFSSSRHWDESSAGTWSLRVRDLATPRQGTWNAWRLRIYGTEISPDKAGPRVTSLTDVNGLVNGGSVSTFRVQFNEPIDPLTFTASDISFRRVGGSAITVSDPAPVAGTNNTVFSVTFAAQSISGNYRVDIGPNIADVAGNLLNQDGDGTNGGSVSDMYSEFFTLANQFIFSNTSTGVIPDTGPGTLTRTVDLPAMDIADLNVLLNVSHDGVSRDLAVSLAAPAGTSVAIADQNTGNSTIGSGNGYLDTILDDDDLLAALISGTNNGLFHYTDRFRPSHSLSAFDGSGNGSGLWTLTLTDEVAGTAGTFKDFSLIVTAAGLSDIRIDSVTNMDSDRGQVEVSYSITGSDAPGFDLGVFGSSDTLFNINSDQASGSIAVTSSNCVAGNSCLAVGTHVIKLSAGLFPDPAFTANQDLFSLVVADPQRQLLDLERSNNYGILIGVTESADGTLYVAGEAHSANSITITNATVTLNGTTVSYTSGNINDVFVTGGTEADSVNASGLTKDVLAFLGAGNDTYVGGEGTDAVQAGAGHDNLSGNGGPDRFYGMIGNDTIQGGAGDDLLSVGEGGVGGGTQSMTGGAGNDKFLISGTPFSDRMMVWDPDNDSAASGTLRAQITSPASPPTGLLAVTTQFVTISDVQTNDQYVLVSGGDGNDVITMENGSVPNSRVRLRAILVGGLGNDTITDGLGVDDIYGDRSSVDQPGDGDDVLDSTDGTPGDHLFGGGGADLNKTPELGDDAYGFETPQSEAEDNNTALTANFIRVSYEPVIVSGSIASNADVDFYQFTLGVRSGVFFDIDSREIGLSTTLNSVLTVYDSSGTTTLPGGSNDDGRDFDGFDLNDTTVTPLPVDSALYMDMAAGTYYVRVSSSGAGNIGAYQLKVFSDTDYSSGIPVLNSNPGAADTLYLDFDGHESSGDAWNPNPYTALPYDFNGNGSEITPGERMAIRNIWRVIAEDFAPFAINVTTVEPSLIANGVAHRQIITNSNGTIVGESSSSLGVAFVGSYPDYGDDDNSAFTFAVNFSYIVGSAGTSGEIMAKSHEIGNTSSHEFGHALSLRHFTQGSQTQAIMYTPEAGLNRARWFSGTNVFNTNQDDMAVISQPSNTIGYRTDDHGNTRPTADVLTLYRNIYAVSGVIAPLTDSDYFRFTVPGGPTTITVSVDRYIADLDAELHVYDASGAEIAVGDPAGENSLGASLVLMLTAGTYYAEVRSDGGIGEAGQYDLVIRI